MSFPKVLGVLAGRDMPAAQLLHWAEDAEFIFAADSGADILHEIGISPDWVIGDFDSIQTREHHGTLFHDPGQDNTDCDKLLLKAIELGYERITLISIEGDQLDHVLATLHSAARHPISVSVVLRTGIGVLLMPGDHAILGASPGQRVSLLPLIHSEGVTLTGVHWPLERATLNPLGLTSIGNLATEGRIEAHLEDGIVFLFVERRAFEPPIWSVFP